MEPIEVIIEVKNGMVVSVRGTEAMTAIIRDFDTDGMFQNEDNVLKDEDGNKFVETMFEVAKEQLS